QGGPSYDSAQTTEGMSWVEVRQTVLLGIGECLTRASSSTAATGFQPKRPKSVAGVARTHLSSRTEVGQRSPSPSCALFRLLSPTPENFVDRIAGRVVTTARFAAQEDAHAGRRASCIPCHTAPGCARGRRALHRPRRHRPHRLLERLSVDRRI